MTDTPSENTSGTTTGGSTSQQTNLQQLATAVGAAVAAAVVQALSSSGAQTVQQQGAQQGDDETFQSSSSQEGIQSQLASLQDDLKKLTDHVSQITSDDVDRATHDTARVGSYSDPSSDFQRLGFQRDSNGTAMLRSTQSMVQVGDMAALEAVKYIAGIWARSLDHFGALPPIAPRSPTGPGTSAG